MASGGKSVQQNSDRSDNNISNSSIRDCVLYKMKNTGEPNNYDLEFIVSIVQHTQITPGLYKKTTDFAGETSYEISSVEPNDTIINAFHIETGPENDWIMNESQIPIVAESHMRELKNENHETIILCIRETIPKIYTTTGNIFIEPMNGIISTNSVFNEFQRLEYVPGSLSNSSVSGKIEEVIDVTALTSSMKTHNLLFNLNCVEDFSKIKSLQKGVAKDELISQAVNHFINLLAVKIELNPEDRILNGEFLSELSNMGIIVASKNDENKPIVDLLKHGDKFLTGESYKNFVNCSDVYCNAGRNFTKIFRLQKENEKFRDLINETLSRYSAQVTACKNFFDANANANANAKDPSITQIFSELNKYVLNQIVRPKKFLIVNVKTRAIQDENGNRKPVNERYAMKTDSNRTYLAIDALTTAVPLYKKVNGNDLMNKDLFESDGTVKDERENKLVCGPFDCISDPNLDNKGIADLPQIKQIVEMLLTHIYVCVFGKGISGSGKTTLMINNIHGTTEDAKKGVMFHLCNLLNTHKDFLCKTIIMKRSEICVDPGSCDVDNDEYEFTWQQVNGVNGFFCVTPEFITKYPVAGCVGNNKENPTSYTCTIKDKSLHEVAEILLTKTRAVNATALNKSSSRSHAQIVLCIKCDGGDKQDRFLTIVDAAGKENIITCSYAMLVKYANSFSEDGENRSYSGVGWDRLSSKRDDVVDFTRIENLLPLVSGGNDSSKASGGGGDRKQQIQDILHVLRGFPEPQIKIEGNILSDEYIEALIDSYTTAKINIAELDPNPASSGIDDKKFPIVGEIENMVKTFLKINKTPVWTKDGYVLPYEGVTQYVKGVIPTSAMGEHSNKYYFDKEKTDSSKSKYKISMVAGSGKSDSRILKIEGWDSFVIEKDLMPVKKMNNGKQEYIKVNGKYDKIEEYVKFDDFVESPFATQYTGTMEEATDANYPQFYDEYNAIVADKSKWLKEQFEPWKKGSPTLTVFISPNKKITLGPLTNYEQKTNSTMQTFIETHFKGNKEQQQQFYEDAKEVKKQLDRFNALTSFVEKECKNRGIEGSQVINPELEKADTVINDICVLQNTGRPSLPLQILGNTEPYDLTHIYNILKGTSATGDITTSIKQSQIIQRMFESIISMNKNKAEGGGAGGGSELGKNQEGEELSNTTKLTYAEIAKTIKFFFFTVINWSPDTELQDKVQYFHTVELRKLLKQMIFDSEFETYDTKKGDYTKKFTEEIEKITGYYTKEALTHVVEISELFKKIEDAKQNLNKANTYEMAISAVKAIVDETNNINASSLIGSIAGDGNTCVEQHTVGLGEQLAKHFSVSLRPRTVA